MVVEQNGSFREMKNYRSLKTKKKDETEQFLIVETNLKTLLFFTERKI